MKVAPGCLRLLLAMAVVLHHSTPLRLGTWAVGLFFCLSGYWIAEMWARRYSRLDRPYVEFVVSRWWRLAPLLFVTTAVAAAYTTWRSDPEGRAVLHRWAWWVTQPGIAGSTALGRLLPPAWSLDVEMQFYLVAPLLIAAVVRWSTWLTVGLIAAAITWCGYAMATGRAGESARLDVWIGVFLIGIAASAGRWRWPRPLVAASVGLTVSVLVVTAVVPATRPWILIRGASAHHPTNGTPATLTVGLILLAIPFTLATTGVPSGRADRFLGDLSYPLYLFHWLPRQWYYAHLGHDPQPIRAAGLLAVNVAAAVGGAVVLLLVVDRPAQRLRARWVARHVVSGRRSPTITDKHGPAQAFAGTV